MQDCSTVVVVAAALAAPVVDSAEKTTAGSREFFRVPVSATEAAAPAPAALASVSFLDC